MFYNPTNENSTKMFSFICLFLTIGGRRLKEPKKFNLLLLLLYVQ